MLNLVHQHRFNDMNDITIRTIEMEEIVERCRFEYSKKIIVLIVISFISFISFILLQTLASHDHCTKPMTSVVKINKSVTTIID